MHAIRIDRSKPLSAEPHTGHNRYHPDIAPVLEVGEGEEAMLETRDAVDGQLSPSSTEAAFANSIRVPFTRSPGPSSSRASSPATCSRSSSSTSRPSLRRLAASSPAWVF
jgi:hypothetical protein